MNDRLLMSSVIGDLSVRNWVRWVAYQMLCKGGRDHRAARYRAIEGD
jgi:hypothetical protein